LQYSHVVNQWAEVNKIAYFPMYLREQECFWGYPMLWPVVLSYFHCSSFFKNRRPKAAGMIGGTALMDG
jgi:hypothetical protein